MTVYDDMEMTKVTNRATLNPYENDMECSQDTRDGIPVSMSNNIS